MKARLAALVFTLLLSAPLGAEAQRAGKVPRIAYLSPQAASAIVAAHAAFREGLREHGYVEGQNLLIEWRFADGNIERLPALAAELVRLNVDVIFVSTGPGAVAARQATGTIPIVFMAVSNPVALGLVASLARPGGNVTGFSNVSGELTQKRLALLKELVPGARKVGVLKPPANPDVIAYMKEIDSAAKSLGLKLNVEAVTRSESFDHAFAAMKTARVDAVILIPAPLFYTHRARVAELSNKARLPVMGFVRELTDAGVLLSYGHNVPDMARRGGAYVARILKGAKPADLPVEQPTKFELVINIKTAKALGLRIPQLLLLRADQVIE